MKTAKLLPLDQAQPGMCLAFELCDPGGTVLLAAGTELTAAMLPSLAKRGVKQVQVEVEETLSPVELAARREAVVQRLDRLFQHEGDDPLMDRLKAVVLAYRLRGLE